MRSIRRLAAQEGMTSTQLAVLFPALLVWILLIVQYGLWYHAKQVADAAAAEGLDVAQVPEGTAEAGEAATRSFLASAGNLERVAVQVDRGPDQVVVEVRGRAPRLVPVFEWGVGARAVGVTERFVPEAAR